MVSLKRLDKTKEYIFQYMGIPKIVKFVGMNSEAKISTHFSKDVPIFIDSSGKYQSFRLTDIYDPDKITNEKRKMLLKTIFEGRRGK